MMEMRDGTYPAAEAMRAMMARKMIAKINKALDEAEAPQ